MAADHTFRSIRSSLALLCLSCSIGSEYSSDQAEPASNENTRTLIRLDGRGGGEVIDVQPIRQGVGVESGGLRPQVSSYYGLGSQNTPCVFSQANFGGDQLCFTGTGSMGITNLTHTSHAGHTWNGIRSARTTNAEAELIGPNYRPFLNAFDSIANGPDGAGSSINHINTINVEWVGANRSFASGSVVVSATNYNGSATPLCMDVKDGSTANGTPVWLWPCHGYSPQIWTWTPSTYELKALGKCLEIKLPVALQAPIQMWDCNGSSNQKWNLVGLGSLGALEHLAFMSLAPSNLVIDIPNGNAVQGQTLWAWTGHWSWPQDFRFYDWY